MQEMRVIVDEKYRLNVRRKQQIRKKIKIIAAGTAKDELKERDVLIRKHFCSLPEYIAARTVYIYISSFNHEVDTFSIIDNLIDEKREVLVPLANEKRYELKYSELKSLDFLKRSRYNVWEPEDRNIVNFHRVDMIVVPGVAFDLKGNRIGSGKGYFDRFLADNDSLKIALAYEFQIIDYVPVTSNDIPVDILITENRIVRITD